MRAVMKEEIHLARARIRNPQRWRVGKNFFDTFYRDILFGCEL